MNNSYMPFRSEILEVIKHADVEYTFRMSYDRGDTHPVKPGQFFEISIPKYGEAPISVSGITDHSLDFTIRRVGSLTEEIFENYVGGHFFMRGPYGNGFDVNIFKGKEIVLITGGSGLPKDEIDRMVKEAEAHEAEDKKRKEDAETRNQAESFAYQTEKLVNDNKDKLSDDVAKEVTDKVNELKEALKGEDIEKIKSAQTELMTSAQKIGQALYAQQGAADAAGAAGAAGAGAAGSASNGSDDDVVDAEVVDDDDKDNK